MDISALTSADVANRKNGKLPSCEPCRKAKVRCDHSRPVCSRCRKRGASSQCFYHPAPLTKPRELSGGESRHGSPVSSKIPSTASGLSKKRALEHPTSPNTDFVTKTPTTTQASALLDDLALEGNQRTHKAASASEYLGDHLAKAKRSIRKLVAFLEHMPRIEDLIKKYYAVSPYALIPNAVLLPALDTFAARWRKASSPANAIEDISSTLLANIHTPIVVTINMRPSEFVKLYITDNPRLETLGLIYTLAVRACLFNSDIPQQQRLEFVQMMYRCSTKALEVSRRLLPQTTDALIWLLYENVLLTTQLTGDASLMSWRRAGELTSEVLVVGMHRESDYRDLPFFLAETRRRTFSAVYNLDKFIATMIERPPRVLKTWLDFNMPLHLPEAVVFSEIAPTKEELQKLVTRDGWHVEPLFSRSAWARLHFIIASFREDIMEIDYNWRPERMQELRNMSLRCHDAWRNLPSYLKYSPDTWRSSEVPTGRATIMTTTYLSYQQLHFAILDLMRTSDASAVPSLIEVSDDLLNAILQLGASRGRASFLNYDYAYLTMAYGIPSAMKLAAALQSDTRSGMVSLPAGLSRSALIRNLSVFVASLDGLHELGEMDKKTSAKASKVLSQILDEVLAPAGSIPQSHPQTPVDAGNTIWDAHFHFPPRTGAVIGDFGEHDWNVDMGIDWNNLNSDWTKF